MSFGAFGNEEVEKMVNHTFVMYVRKRSLDEQVAKIRGVWKSTKEYLISALQNERATADFY